MTKAYKKFFKSNFHSNVRERKVDNYLIHPDSSLYRLCTWLEKKTDTIFLTPHITAIGNCADDLYYGLMKARHESKKLVLVWPYELPGYLKFGLTNSELINIDSDYRAFPSTSRLNTTVRLLVTVYFAIFRSLSLIRRFLFGQHLSNVYRIPVIGEATLWSPGRMSQFSWEAVSKCEWDKQWRTPLPVGIESSRLGVANRLRISMGLSMESWYVCLHVRESGFRDSMQYREGNLYQERNANIKNYLDAIREITSRGGWVVRMGDPTMTKLPSMDGVIDYPFTEFKSDLMDVYLISQCRFYIGMVSGIFNVAELFQRPMLTVNLNNWIAGFPQKKDDMAIFKHIFSKSRNRFLSLKEWLSEPWDSVSWSHKLGDDYVFIENSPSEIKSTVIEFMDRDSQAPPTEKQLEFNRERIRFGKALLSKPLFKADDVVPYYRLSLDEYDILQRYRLASRLESAIGLVGSKYLEDHWENAYFDAAGQCEIFSNSSLNN